jgi:flavin reductase (DIM6/NTAB) family NADH-FMN oxidoreductase RutF
MPSGDDLRSLMRLFPAGVCVVGADAHGDRIAVTVGSLISLSLEPPLVGISIGRDLALHELVRSAGAFGISILRGDQADVAAQFARGAPPIVLWEGVATRDGVTGAPLLADALAWLECRVWAEYDAGDHTLFVGEVVALEEGEPGPGLVYREHGYRSV